MKTLLTIILELSNELNNISCEHSFDNHKKQIIEACNELKELNKLFNNIFYSRFIDSMLTYTEYPDDANHGKMVNDYWATRMELTNG